MKDREDVNQAGRAVDEAAGSGRFCIRPSVYFRGLVIWVNSMWGRDERDKKGEI
jgi:hypothetical protein